MFERFDTGRFWQELRETGSTMTCGLIGSMAEFLLKAPPRADDAQNPLRMLTMVPINDNDGRASRAASPSTGCPAST